MPLTNNILDGRGDAPQWLAGLRKDRDVRKRIDAEYGMRTLSEKTYKAKERMSKMAVTDEWFVQQHTAAKKKAPVEHKAPGANAMLNHILSELGPEFFSDQMKKDPEEKAREDQEKFEQLRDAVYWGEVQKLPKLIRNGASMYKIEDQLTKKTLFHMAAVRNQAAAIRKLYELRSNKFPDPIHTLDAQNCNALHDAALKGNNEALTALVELKADLANQDSLERKTCLHKAAEGGFVNTVKQLIRLKMDMNARDRDKETALHKVAKLGFSDVITALVEMGADADAPDKDGSTPLHLAAKGGKEHTIQLLVELGCRVEGKDLSGGTPLHVAAMNGMAGALNLLVLKLGSEVNATDMYKETPLHRAATLGKDETVKLLVHLKAHINCVDKYMETPMHRAAAMGKESTIRTLVALKAQPDCKDMDFRTPLHAAAAKWQRHAMVELTDHGCSLLDKDNFGETPLHRAAAMEEKDAMHTLVEMGAEIGARNDLGETALQLQARRSVEHTRMLMEKDDVPLMMGVQP